MWPNKHTVPVQRRQRVPKWKSAPADTDEPKLLAASSPTHATDLVPSPDTPVTVTLKDPAEPTTSVKPAALTLAGVWTSPDAPMVQYTVAPSSTLPVTVTDEGDVCEVAMLDNVGAVVSTIGSLHLHAATCRAGPWNLRALHCKFLLLGMGWSDRCHAPPKKLWNPQYV